MLIIYPLTFLLLLTYITSNDSLFFVFGHFRHGARTPWRNLSKNYTDILGVQWFGLGELTQVGINQLYRLGLHSKGRYKDFISLSYDPKEIIVYSTNVNRTIASAQAHMAGMFSQSTQSQSGPNDKEFPPINSSEPINASIPFIPIPIHTFEEKRFGLNTILFQTFTYDKSTNCPNVIPIRKANLKSKIVIDFIRNFTSNYSSFFKEEYNISNLTYATINDICDSFICSYFDSKDLSKFINKGINTTTFLHNCYDLEYIKQFHVDQGGKANFTGVMTMSATMLQMVTMMEKRIEINDNKQSAYSAPKLVLYSGHDSTITSMESFLNSAFNCSYEYTPFGSSQFFELHKRQNVFWVEYYYNNALQFNITFNDFKEKVNDIAWSDYETNDFCLIMTLPLKIVIAMLMVSIALVVITISMLCYYGKRRLSSRGFMKVIETKDDESPVNSIPSTSTN